MISARRLELHLSYECAQACVFCSEAARMARWRRILWSGAEIAKILIHQRRRGRDHLTLTGGEPTAHPAFLKTAAAARRLGYRVYATTNGGRISDPDYARRAAPLINELCVSLHGADAVSHDAQAGVTGSFERAMRACSNVRACNPELSLRMNSVVVRDSLSRVGDVIDAAARAGAGAILLSNVAPEGRAESAYARLAAPLLGWRRAASALARRARRARIELRFFGLPLCALGDVAELSNDLWFSPRVTVERGDQGEAVEIQSADASRGRAHARACANCRERGRCHGPFARYTAELGEAELSPL